MPRTLEVFVIGVAGVGFILALIVAFLLGTFFRKEIIYMSREQELEVHEILKNSGSASIFFSVSILLLNIEFAGLEEFTIPNLLLILVPPLILFIYAVYSERKSSKLAHQLAISLINSGWYERYSARS